MHSSAALTEHDAGDRDVLAEPPFAVRSYRIAGDMLVVELVGGLDMASAPLLDAAFAMGAGPAGTPPAKAEVDLRGLTFLDTAGLDALNTTVTGLEAAGARVTVVGAGRQARRLLHFAAEHCWLTAGPILTAGTSV